MTTERALTLGIRALEDCATHIQSNCQVTTATRRLESLDALKNDFEREVRESIDELKRCRDAAKTSDKITVIHVATQHGVPALAGPVSEPSVTSGFFAVK